MSVVHFGEGPALWIGNNGTGDIASFYDTDQNVEILHVGGNNGSFPNVGVKTSSPNKTLTVNGEISSSGDISTSGRILSGGTELLSIVTSITNPLTVSSTNWNNVYTSVNTTSANYILDGGNSKASNLLIGTSDNYNVALETNNIPRITIVNLGNVGINTQTPNENLTVSGNISASGIISASASNINVNIVNVSTNINFTNDYNNKIVHFDTTTNALTASFPDTLNSGFNVAIMNVGTNNLLVSAVNLKSTGTIINTQYGGAFVYKELNNIFAVGRFV